MYAMETTRRKSRQVTVGGLPIGGDAPIAVQSMLNTDSHDADACFTQAKALEEAAKAGNYAVIKEHHEDVMDTYKKMAGSIFDLLGMPGGDVESNDGDDVVLEFDPD